MLLIKETSKYPNTERREVKELKETWYSCINIRKKCRISKSFIGIKEVFYNLYIDKSGHCSKEMFL